MTLIAGGFFYQSVFNILVTCDTEAPIITLHFII